MGTYLFPVSEDTHVLEVLAGVPLGTSARLTAFNQAAATGRMVFSTQSWVKAAMGDFEAQPEYWDLVFWERELNPDLCRLNYFNQSGWGKMHGPAWNIIAKSNQADPHYGQVTDPQVIRELLSHLGITVPDWIRTKIAAIEWR